MTTLAAVPDRHPVTEYRHMPKPKSNKHLRRMEAQARQRLIREEQRVVARREAVEVAQGMQETVALAERRGEHVETLASGARRVNDRDPILRLLRAGYLTVEQYDTGRDLRDLYDARLEGLGSQMEMLACTTGAGTGTSDAAVWAGIRRGQAIQRIGATERAILTGQWRRADGTLAQVEGWSALFRGEARVEPHLALAMLRAVCGDGKSLSRQGEGRAFERNARALAAALDVAAVLLPRSRRG